MGRLGPHYYGHNTDWVITIFRSYSSTDLLTRGLITFDNFAPYGRPVTCQDAELI
jgi:hypothetical protein